MYQLKVFVCIFFKQSNYIMVFGMAHIFTLRAPSKHKIINVMLLSSLVWRWCCLNIQCEFDFFPCLSFVVRCFQYFGYTHGDEFHFMFCWLAIFKAYIFWKRKLDLFNKSKDKNLVFRWRCFGQWPFELILFRFSSSLFPPIPTTIQSHCESELSLLTIRFSDCS